ncbi:hypothetical protein [Chitinibacter sp. GC72]|uniref:hypothetical protein n=1 Tax=Chitinibacter sp. GC72 TaxID=1526917 RepID=UPI0012F7BA83|nr:hypothetical protein [Chitinibacter sp. GC72]
MRAVKTLTVSSFAVEVRELTVADIRLWLQDLLTVPEPDLIAEALFDELSLTDLPRLTSLMPAQIDSLTPSELRQVIEAAKAVNADFFGLRQKLTLAARTVPNIVPNTA